MSIPFRLTMLVKEHDLLGSVSLFIRGRTALNYYNMSMQKL